jgi:hypothetical protein
MYFGDLGIIQRGKRGCKRKSGCGKLQWHCKTGLNSATSGFNAETLHLPPEGALVDSQFPGRFPTVAFVSMEGLHDQLGLGPLKKGCERKGDGFEGFFPARLEELLGQVTKLNLRSVAENKGMLQEVFQFPDISREAVGHKKIHDLRPNSKDLFPPPQVKAMDEMVHQ